MSDLSQFFSDLGSKQRDQRVKRFFTDQFGRRYFAWADKDNQRPIGEFVLADKTGMFTTAPWNPPMGYIDWPDHDTLDFAWRFESLASELAGFTAEWYSHAQQLAQAANLTIPDVGGTCHPTLIGLMGPPPLSPEIPLSCDAGEPWVLGRIGAPVNTHLKTLINQGRMITSTYALEAIKRRVQAMIEAGKTDLSDLVLTGAPVIEAPPENYYEFMAAQIKAGKSSSDAQREWKSLQQQAA